VLLREFEFECVCVCIIKDNFALCVLGIHLFFVSSFTWPIRISLYADVYTYITNLLSDPDVVCLTDSLFHSGVFVYSNKRAHNNTLFF
jgi:hypothetical protein